MSRKKESSTIDPLSLPAPGLVGVPTVRERMAMVTENITRLLEERYPEQNVKYLNAQVSTLPEDYMASMYWQELLHKFKHDAQIVWLKQRMLADNPKWMNDKNYGYVVRPEVLSGRVKIPPNLSLNDETYMLTDFPFHVTIYNNLGTWKAMNLWREHGAAKFYDWRPVLKELEDSQWFRINWLLRHMTSSKQDETQSKAFRDFSDWIKYSDVSLWTRPDLARRLRAATSQGVSEAELDRLERAVKQSSSRFAIKCNECPVRLKLLRSTRRQLSPS